MNYKLMQEVDGYPSVHTEDLNEKEANEMLQRHRNFFPESYWWIEPYEESEKAEHYYNRDVPRGAVDGWEDLFSND